VTFKEIDPRLERIRQTVTMGTMVNILKGLEKVNQVEPIPGNDWQLCGKLTEGGFNLISDAVIVGLEVVFKRSQITFPASLHFDETKFSNLIIEQTGLPSIRITNNQIDIQFTNDINKSPIKFLSSYLDPNKEMPLPRIVKKLEITKGGLLITQTISSYN
jgi:hypothetical protein